MTWPSEASCGECYLEGVDTSGNLPCPRCGSSERVLPRDLADDLASSRAAIVFDLDVQRAALERGDGGL